jgi:hypothetical protein
MITSPTPEQSATAILDDFKSKNLIAGDPLLISYSCGLRDTDRLRMQKLVAMVRATAPSR